MGPAGLRRGASSPGWNKGYRVNVPQWSPPVFSGCLHQVKCSATAIMVPQWSPPVVGRVTIAQSEGP
jgi:hypothetical protein